MGAVLDDPPGLDDEDLVGRPDRGQPVGDDDGRATGERLAQRLLDGRLGGRVEVRGGLVEDDDARPGEQQAGDRQPLTLAAGEPVAALADHRVEAVGQRARRGRPAGPGAARPTARRRSAPGRASSRLARSDSWNRWPSCVTSPSAPRIASNDEVADVDTADPDRARVDVVEAGEQRGDRRLARARRADQRDHLPRLGPERDARAAPRRRRGCRGARRPPARRATPGRRPGSRTARRRAPPTAGRRAAGGASRARR